MSGSIEARGQAGEERLQQAMALLTALASLTNGFESFVEHQRGAYRNRWMWTPVILSPLAGAAGLAAVFSQRAARSLLPWASLVLLADGLVGTWLHLRGARRMPGGFRFGTYNLSMGPPLFAPLLLGSVGLFGLTATILARRPAERGRGGAGR